MKQLLLEVEQDIRELIAVRQSEKKLDLYRGTPLLWQVVDDELYGKAEAKKIQQAIGAPVPEQLEHWEKTGREPIPLPLTNDTLARWRDHRRVNYSADFDPKKLAEDRKREGEFLYQRLEGITNQT